MSKIKLEAFKENTYRAYSGARKFRDGSKPLIARNLKGTYGTGAIKNITLICEYDGIHIDLGNMSSYYQLWKNFRSADEARKYVDKCLDDPIDGYKLRELGFKYYK